MNFQKHANQQRLTNGKTALAGEHGQADANSEFSESYFGLVHSLHCSPPQGTSQL
jgi:hypothetical protein